jgi:hypothetical protein
VKQNIREAILQHSVTWIEVSRNRLTEFRHVSQQRADILNIFYCGEYEINYYIWLIINERSKQCVLTVPAARKHFCRQVTQRFRRKLQTAKISIQSAYFLNARYIRVYTHLL